MIAPLFLHRYVDDFFGCLQTGCAEHGMQCFAELVRLLMGSSAVSDKKLGYGNPLTILGLDIEVHSVGMTCFPSGDKVLKWLNVIREAVSSNKLTAGAASKLAGGLSWSAQNMFNRSVAFGLSCSLVYSLHCHFQVWSLDAEATVQAAVWQEQQSQQGIESIIKVVG